MAEILDRDTLPQATLTPRRRTRVSAIWLIPTIAALVALGIAVNRILSEGPTISIVFESAEGVEAGKTFIRYKDVKIGQVTAVELRQDYSKVEVTAKIDKHAEGLMVADANFWVVQPSVTLSGVTGLGTLLSGNYIGFQRGQSRKAQRHFTGLEKPPAIPMDRPGRRYSLEADDLGSLGIGSPIYFRRLRVGQVVDYELAADGQAVRIGIFVEAPYDRFVTADTRFWNASGLDISVGAGGVDVRTQSLVSLLIGGLAFDAPVLPQVAEPAAADAAFPLFSDRATAMKQPQAVARRYVLYTSDSLRGLSKGAPVTFLGLPAGEVTEVGLDLDPQTQTLRGRIEVVALPEGLVTRLQGEQAATVTAVAASEQRSHAFFKRMIEEQGLRAQLRSGSLITGQLYVAFDFFPDAAKVAVDWSQETPVLPLVPSTLPDLESKVSGILAKIDALPLAAIGTDIEKVLETLDRALKGVSTAVAHFDTQVTPGLKPAIAELRRALAAADRMLRDADATLVGKDAPGQIELRAALQEVTRAARSLRVLSDYLERHPEALLRGKSEVKP